MMKLQTRRGAFAAFSIGAGLALASPAHAIQHVGDLVYCDVDANGVYDGADYKLDGVEVRVTCRDANGIVCFDQPATTGVLHPSVDAGAFNATCGPRTGVTTADLSGRYIVEVLGVNGAVPGCFAPTPGARPFECTVTVNEATLPTTCDGLVTPLVGLPADGNGDGDWCDAEDGPFPEGQVLGDNGMPGPECEFSASPGPSDGLHRVMIVGGPVTPCALYADFGYTPRATECVTRTPGFWKTHPKATGDNLPVAFCGRTVTDVCDAIGLLSTQGGGLSAFTRHAMAASLNCSAFGCPAEIAALIADGNAACATGANYDFGAAAGLLDDFNNSCDAKSCDLDHESADPHFCRSDCQGKPGKPAKNSKKKDGKSKAKKR
jgi:hypothetical protein